MGGLVFRVDLPLDDRIEEDRGAHVATALGHGIELMQRGGHLRFHLEDAAEDLLNAAPALARGE